MEGGCLECSLAGTERRRQSSGWGVHELLLLLRGPARLAIDPGRLQRQPGRGDAGALPCHCKPAGPLGGLPDHCKPAGPLSTLPDHCKPAGPLGAPTRPLAQAWPDLLPPALRLLSTLQAFREASNGPMKGILAISDEPLVSCDYRQTDVSSTIDAALTMVMGDDMVKVVAWYDNEWGYSQRVVDLAEVVAKEWK